MARELYRNVWTRSERSPSLRRTPYFEDSPLSFRCLATDTLSLKDRSGAVSSGSISLRRMLVGIQMFLSLLLLFGAGLFVRTLRNLESLGREGNNCPLVYGRAIRK